MPNKVELVRLRMLRVLDGVLEPSVELLLFAYKLEEESDWFSNGGVGGEGALKGVSSNGRRGRGLRAGPSSSSWGSGWLIMGGVTFEEVVRWRL